MRSYIALALTLLVSGTLISQNSSSNGNIVKLDGVMVQNYKNQSNVVENKTGTNSQTATPAQLAGSFQIFPTKNAPSSLLNVGLPFNNQTPLAIKAGTSLPQTSIDVDPRNLVLSPNGNLLSPDGYEIEFRTSGNKKVTDVCATRRPYFIGGDKNAACNFTVPCDDPNNRDAASTATKYFMLRWHVITNGSPTDNIDQAMITAMMNTLNADYAAHNMIFCEDSAEWNDDVTHYFHDSNTEEVLLKTAYNTRPADLINIYVVGDMTAGGYARFPYDPMGGTNYRGGIVLNRGNCNATGHTLAHEMGHTFGLEHTFAGVDERPQCSACYERVRNANGSPNTTGVPSPFGGPFTTEGDQEGDWCSDTNPHDTYTYNCSTSSNPNGACDSGPWNNAPVNNHMSYSFCSTQFTTQQRYRQHCMANSYLASWTSYGGGICGTQPPVAEFVGSPTTWQSPSTVAFTDLSQPTSIITSWTWNFNNAGQAGTVTPATYTSTTTPNPPPVIYDILASGVCLDYEVTLTVTSGNGNDTETKTSYITVCPPSGDCDTLDFQWTSPTPSVTTYNISPTDHMTGVPDAINLLLPTDAKGVYEGYVNPNLGVSTVGAVRVALGTLVDANDDMTFQVVVYDDDGNGQPGAILGGRGGISPTQLGVPAGGFYNEFWIPLFTPLTPTTNYFHVGVEIFAGGAADEMIVMTSCDHAGPPLCGPQGEADSSNNIFSSGFGYEKLMPVYGYDGDVDVIPMLGEYTPLPIVTGFTENVVCDTTYVTIFDTVLYHDYGNPAALVGMSYTFASDGLVINTTTPLSSINRVYTTAGPETLTITAINDCGRADTTVWTIPYNFLETPDAEFTMVQPNPVCLGDPIDFNANTTGYADYTWDFGDGNVVSTGAVPTVNYTYPAIGLYYSSLTVTTTSFQAINTFYSEDFESGWPAGYARFTNDPFTPNAAMNPPFTGTNATAWVDIDGDGDGSTEATSCSWHLNPGEQADDWMMTSGIGPLPANQMLSWDGEVGNANFPDGYEVRISTTQLPATVGNYATVLTTVPAENGFRTTRNVSLAAYAGQTVFIAFRNNSTDQFLLYIDNIHVGTSGPGCTSTTQYDDFVEVVDCSVIPPVADMNLTDTAGCAPLTVTFTDNTSQVPDPSTSWVWNFGDGTFSTLQNPPAHVYPAGTYFTSFQSCNAGGCSTVFQTIIVGTGTTADAGVDQAICGGTTATLAGNDPTPDLGVWATLTGPGAPTTVGQFNTGVTGLGAGLNQFTWTITGTGCVTVDTVDITIGTPANAGTDAALATCSASPTTDLFTLIGVADLGGTWVPAMASGTGVFNPAVDPAATYQYVVTGTTPCPDDTADVVVTLTATDDPTFTYADFCAGSGGVSGVPTTGGGTWSFNPDPLDGSTIVPGTGVIANEVAGSTYNVQYLTGGACPDSLTVAINVGTPASAGTDGALSTCSTAGTTDLFTLIGVADLGGTWVPAMASGTGVFNPAVDPGVTYQYVVTGTAPCANDTADVVVTLTTTDDPTFTYADFCAGSGGVSGVPTTVGGTWSFNPDPLDGSTIVPGTGVIANAVAGSTYNIQYLTPAGGCQDSLTIAVNIGTPSNAGTDGALSTCSGSGTTDLFTLIGAADLGGTWVPAMASGTGVFNPAIDPGVTYQYVVTGTAPCPNDTSDVVVTLTTNDDPTFTYSDFCAGSGGVSGVPTTVGGSWSFNPDPLDGSTIVPGTGAIANAVAGSTYNVQYLTPAGPCQDSLTVAVNILTPANAGTDNTLGICATGIPIDLFTLLGVADLGGTWVPAMASGTGVFNPAVDPGATYQYVVIGGGSCSNDTADVVVTLTATDDPTFIYADFCAGSGGIAGIINTPGGSFNFDPDPLDGSTINPGTGAIANGVAGSIYNIEYTTPAGPCQDSLTIAVNVGTPANAGTDAVLAACSSAGTTDLYTLLGVADLGGAWFPALASGTGVFNPAVDPSATYQYVITGVAPCSNDTADVVVTVTPTDDPTFTYADFCAGSGGVSGVPTTVGGTWSFNPDPLDGSTIIPGTGAIANAVAGSTYNVQYLTNGVCPDSLTVVVNVGAPANAGTDNVLASCATGGTTDLFTLIGAADLGGTWFPAMASGTGVFNPAVDPSATYQYVVTGTAPCADDTADVVVTVTPTDDPTFIYADFCAPAGGFAGVTATPGGVWSFNPDPLDGSVINAGTGAITNAVGSSIYNIQYLTAGPCPDSMTVAVNVNPCLVLVASFTTSSTTICAGDSVVFTDGSTVGTTIWQWDFDSTSAGGVLPTAGIGQGPHTVFYNTAGTYTVELIISDGITSDTTSTVITVNDCAPTADFSASQTNICEGDCITFTDLSTNSPTSYSWTFPGGNPLAATGANPGSICYDTAGTYAVTLTVLNQYGYDSLIMTNYITVGTCLPPTAFITMNDTDGHICVNNCIDFTYDPGTGGVPDTLDWIFEGGTPSTYSSNNMNEVISVCWNDTMNTFNVSVAVSNAFGNSNASDTVFVHAPPTVNAGPDQSVTIGTDGFIDATVVDTAGNFVNGGTFTWSPPTNLSCTECQSSTVLQPLTTNTYTITYEDEYGCIVTDDVLVRVDIVLNIGVPSAFSPNGDGSNDFLWVKGKIVIETMNFVIYNRYGQKVFETTDIDEGWDGTHNGSELNHGVFVWYLNTTFIDGTTGEFKGNVTLVR